MPRIDLRVPFSQKDQAKRLGAKWDAINKVWFVHSDVDISTFERWLPLDADYINVQADHYFIMEGSCECWKCARSTRLLGFLLPDGHESLWIGDTEEEDFWERIEMPGMITGVTNLVPAVAERIRQFGDFYRQNLNKTTAIKRWMNHCENCGVKQGDFYPHPEPGMFGPLDKEAAAKIIFHHVAEPFGCSGSATLGDTTDELWDLAVTTMRKDPQSEQRSFWSKVFFWR
ncbi:DUF5710 domain-containing protein [Agrobacterium tumefaciens]|uniref:DUF5710 domain-containing protein n=1 Tax=Agrobacterium tumefaciens TaxID=358 RepID=UPI001572F7D6